MGLFTINTDIATKYGIASAFLLQNIFYWTQFNWRKNKNFHEGRYWMYNSNKDFLKEMPFLTANQIRVGLERLRKEDLIMTNRFGRGGDRTLWYAVTAKGLKYTKKGDGFYGTINGRPYKEPTDDDIIQDGNAQGYYDKRGRWHQYTYIHNTITRGDLKKLVTNLDEDFEV